MDDDFLTAVGPDGAAALAERGVERAFARGQALVHEGQLPDRVLLICEGTVKVSATTAAGRDVVLAVRGPGALVGELSALAGATRSASVVALEPVRALVLTQDAFRAVLAAHPPAAMALLRLLAERLRDADTKRAEFAGLTTMGRVAVRLLELAERFGTAGDGEVRITLRLTQEELAGWCGASLESVGRALQTMRSLGWIETARRDIRVLDVEALRRAAV